MLSLEQRIGLTAQLGAYMRSDNEEWMQAQQQAISANQWFTAEHILLSANNIADEYLEQQKLINWAQQYSKIQEKKTVGIVMAGNIPLVGFHDMLCGFISGHKIMMKLSSKDEVLLKHLVAKLKEWQPEVADYLEVADMLKGCDAYIATGSNNTARYFEQYFGKYPHIIRKNRTSVAVLDGSESDEELRELAADVFTYFGLGCRNITQVCLPSGYDLTKLLSAMSAYEDVIHHNKYKNNYDYHLAIYLLNKVPYKTNDSLLMVENALPFSAVSVLHYKYYSDRNALLNELKSSNDIQGISGHGLKPFGMAQKPTLEDYADGIDTMQFLSNL